MPMDIHKVTIKHSPEFVLFEEDDVESSIPARFETQTKKFPDKVAVKEKNITLTYRELNEKSNQLGRVILSHESAPDTPITILTSYGIPAIIAMIGVLKTGMAFVSVNPGNPQARIIEIINSWAIWLYSGA